VPAPVAAQTSITLDNGEGAILVEEETDGLDIAGGSTVIASGPTNGPAAALSASSSASGSSVSQGSLGPLPSELLLAKSFERLLPGLFVPNATGAGLLAEQRDASAELDEFLSLWAVEKINVSLAGGNGPTADWPTQSGQPAMTASRPPASLWLGSMRPSKASNNSSFTESSSQAEDAAAGAPVNDLVTPSSAS